MRRSRSSIRADLQQQQRPQQLHSIYFDGRKDVTLHNTKIGGSYHIEKYKEEHIVIIEEPKSLYVGHVTPKTGKSVDIVAAMTSFFEKEHINTDEVLAIGCDGCNVNVGHINGAIVLLEKHFKRPLHWYICLLHANELLLRNIFEKIDGTTTGPNSFSGSIGKAIVDCQTLPIMKFKAIKIEQLPNENLNLSTDQDLLYKMCRAVHIGEVTENLANMKPGPISHSRWLTTAIRVLRLYVSVEMPSKGLTDIATFIMKVYARMWFKIRMNPYISEGPKHVLEMIHATRYLHIDLRTGIDKVIQRNAFFAHHEALLITMVCDDNAIYREIGYRRMLNIRDRMMKGTESSLRRFVVPTVNFDAKEYISLISWENIQSTPPLLQNMSTDELRILVKEKQFKRMNFEFPCHTQAVERGIKMVTEASMHVCGEKSRDGIIWTRGESRNQRKTFETKSDFFSPTK
jgi:hypothetical protein